MTKPISNATASSVGALDPPAPVPTHDLNAGSTTKITVASEFFTAVFDLLTYFVCDARDRLRDGVIEEMSNGGMELDAGHPHWEKYSRERDHCRWVLTDM